jgi:hypothetical protein
MTANLGLIRPPWVYLASIAIGGCFSRFRLSRPLAVTD